MLKPFILAMLLSGATFSAHAQADSSRFSRWQVQVGFGTAGVQYQLNKSMQVGLELQPFFRNGYTPADRRYFGLGTVLTATWLPLHLSPRFDAGIKVGGSYGFNSLSGFSGIRPSISLGPVLDFHISPRVTLRGSYNFSVWQNHPSGHPVLFHSPDLKLLIKLGKRQN